MRTPAAALLFLVLPGLAQVAGPSRADLQTMEKSLDGRLARFAMDNPFNVIGPTRGTYIDGTGVLFSAEVSLVPVSGLSPFRPPYTQEEKEKLHKAKMDKVPSLKQVMREFLLASASSLDRLPPEEQVVVAVTLFYHNWEIQTGLPQQLVMSAKKKPLVDVGAGRIDKSQLETLVKVREY
jgi:hypothetical protein